MKDATRIGADFRAAHPTALFIEGDSISPIPISAVAQLEEMDHQFCQNQADNSSASVEEEAEEEAKEE